MLPRFGSPSKFKQTLPKPPSGALRLSEIVHAQKRFTALMFGLDAFRQKLAGDKNSFPAAASDEPKVQSLAEIAKQMRAMQTHMSKET